MWYEEKVSVRDSLPGRVVGILPTFGHDDQLTLYAFDANTRIGITYRGLDVHLNGATGFDSANGGQISRPPFQWRSIEGGITVTDMQARIIAQDSYCLKENLSKGKMPLLTKSASWNIHAIRRRFFCTLHSVNIWWKQIQFSRGVTEIRNLAGVRVRRFFHLIWHDLWATHPSIAAATLKIVLFLTCDRYVRIQHGSRAIVHSISHFHHLFCPMGQKNKGRPSIHRRDSRSKTSHTVLDLKPF